MSTKKLTLEQEVLLLETMRTCDGKKWMYYNASGFWSVIDYCVGLPGMIIAGFVSAYFQSSCVNEYSQVATAQRVLLALLVVLQAIQTFFKPQQKSSECNQVSNDYGKLANSIRAELALKEEEREDGRLSVILINRDLDAIDSTAPGVPWIVARRFVNKNGEVDDSRVISKIEKLQEKISDNDNKLHYSIAKPIVVETTTNDKTTAPPTEDLDPKDVPPMSFRDFMQQKTQNKVMLSKRQAELQNELQRFDKLVASTSVEKKRKTSRKKSVVKE